MFCVFVPKSRGPPRWLPRGALYHPKALFIIIFECRGAKTSHQYVLNSHLPLTVLKCNCNQTDVFVLVFYSQFVCYGAFIHLGCHRTAMQISHIIKPNTGLGWPMGPVRQNRSGPMGFLVRLQTLHHPFPNSLRKRTCRMVRPHFFGDLKLCCLE